MLEIRGFCYPSGWELPNSCEDSQCNKPHFDIEILGKRLHFGIYYIQNTLVTEKEYYIQALFVSLREAKTILDHMNGNGFVPKVRMVERLCDRQHFEKVIFSCTEERFRELTKKN